MKFKSSFSFVVLDPWLKHGQLSRIDQGNNYRLLHKNAVCLAGDFHAQILVSGATSSFQEMLLFWMVPVGQIHFAKGGLIF